uniref:Uncharacterized protein n=1 Tax=Mustela putorius furo TaxID=9669 RepID=M3YXU3_MUSPF
EPPRALACGEGKGRPSAAARPGSLFCKLYQRPPVQLDKLQESPDREARGRQSRRPNPTHRGRPTQPHPGVFSPPGSFLEPTKPSRGDREPLEGVQRAGADPPEITQRACALSRHLRAVAGLPLPREPLGARTYPESARSGSEEFLQARTEAGELAHSSRPTPSCPASEDVRQARRRLRERGFTPDPGRRFRWACR